MDILTDIRNHIAFITPNRPAALNALSYDMIVALNKTLQEYVRDANVHAALGVIRC